MMYKQVGGDAGLAVQASGSRQPTGSTTYLSTTVTTKVTCEILQRIEAREFYVLRR